MISSGGRAVNVSTADAKHVGMVRCRDARACRITCNETCDHGAMEGQFYLSILASEVASEVLPGSRDAAF